MENGLIVLALGIFFFPICIVLGMFIYPYKLLKKLSIGSKIKKTLKKVFNIPAICAIILHASCIFAIILFILIILPFFGIDFGIHHTIERYLTFFHSFEPVDANSSISIASISSSSYAMDINYGSNGDAFGAINPFIALFAALLTFIAFFTQYAANKNMLSDNKKQQHERSYYEMLKIHMDNIRALVLPSPNGSVIDVSAIKGHEVFLSLRVEINILFDIVQYIDKTDKETSFKKAYKIFFLGIDNAEASDNLKLIIEEIRSNNEDDDEKKNAALCRESILVSKGFENCAEYIKRAKNIYRNPVEFGMGKIYQLDHYYRHLYYMVKSVDSSKKFEDSEKEMYLKILRAQMTSDEQILLLYNWHYGLGSKWEKKEENQFYFSKCKMIHNIFPSNCIFTPKEIFEMFPEVSLECKEEMFENFKPLKI